MAIEDIGQVLFVDILKMSQYPGSPFTGNIFNDLVMFFFIPTVFIILVVYMMVARVLPVQYTGLRFLLGIAAYLFIIVGGYYSLFAYLAGPYFMFLILFMGLLFYFTRHFQRTGSGLHGSTTRGREENIAGSHYEHMGRIDLMREKKRLGQEIADLEREIKEAQKSGEQSRLEPLRMRKVELNAEIRRIDHQLKFVKI